MPHCTTLLPPHKQKQLPVTLVRTPPFSFLHYSALAIFDFSNPIVTSPPMLLWITQSTDATCMCWHNASSTTNSRSSDCRCRVRNLLLPHFYISVLQWSFFTLIIMPPSAALKKSQPTFTCADLDVLSTVTNRSSGCQSRMRNSPFPHFYISFLQLTF